MFAKSFQRLGIDEENKNNYHPHKLKMRVK